MPNRTRHEDQHFHTTILPRNMNPFAEMGNTGGAPEPENESQSGNTLPHYGANHSVTPTYLGENNVNMNDGGSATSDFSNGATFNTWPQPGHDSMTYGSYHHDSTVYGGYGRAIGEAERVTSPEPYEQASAGSVPTRKSHSNRHTGDAAPRAKHDKLKRKKKDSTDSYMSTLAEQGSAPESDGNEQAPKPKGKKSKHRKNKDDLPQGFGDAPWNHLAGSQDKRIDRVSQNVFDPNLPTS